MPPSPVVWDQGQEALVARVSSMHMLSFRCLLQVPVWWQRLAASIHTVVRANGSGSSRTWGCWCALTWLEELRLGMFVVVVTGDGNQS